MVLHHMYHNLGWQWNSYRLIIRPCHPLSGLRIQLMFQNEGKPHFLNQYTCLWVVSCIDKILLGIPAIINHFIDQGKNLHQFKEMPKASKFSILHFLKNLTPKWDWQQSQQWHRPQLPNSSQAQAPANVQPHLCQSMGLNCKCKDSSKEIPNLIGIAKGFTHLVPKCFQKAHHSIVRVMQLLRFCQLPLRNPQHAKA